MSKILTRYNTEFGMLRELIQNSDDAAAERVEIMLHLDEQQPKHRIVSKVSIFNSGREFSAADWSRVTKIAAGNPDANSVGLFGVGFYSVFASSDHPEILSGGKAMRFALEGDAYYTHERTLDVFASGTTVVCPIRADADAVHWAEVEELDKLRAMLMSTLIFARALTSIQLQVSGSPALLFRRQLTPQRKLQHEPPVRQASGPGFYGGPPLFSVAGRQVDISKLELWIEVDGQTRLSTELLQVRATSHPLTTSWCQDGDAPMLATS